MSVERPLPIVDSHCQVALSEARASLLERLSRGEFEHRQNPLKALFYHFERRLGHRLFRRAPPRVAAPRLLNLGCGPLRYPGWVNADDYAFKRALRQREFAPDWRLDVTRPWCCESDYWDGIFSQHVFEHLHYSDAIFAMRECFRTLRPGAWLRVSVPDIRRTVDCYDARTDARLPVEFPHRALSISFLTQMHGHVSAWDGSLMSAVMQALGFLEVREVAHGTGVDARLVMDQEEKRRESVYVEARKPA
jgi:predicted SAM-dependent methyltransferase